MTVCSFPLRALARTAPWTLALVLDAVRPALAQPARSEGPQIEVVDIALDVGEQRVVPTEGVRSYSEGTPGIIDVRLTKDGKQFVIVGQKSGATSLLLMLSEGRERQLKLTVRDSSSPASKTAPDVGVGRKDNIRLDLYFVELRSSQRSQVGVGWPATFGGGQLTATFDLLNGSMVSATASITDQALPRLDLACSGGWAKISRQAAVVTANGAEATFSGGGEVNIPIRGALAAEIRTIEFGSTVKMLPVYDHVTGRIELALSAEVSDLTEDNGTGAPGRARAHVQTVVNLELGQALVLGGLTARSEGRATAGLPWLSQVPILGILFGTHARRNEESENIVMIVPTVVSSLSLPAKERIREALRIYDAYQGEPTSGGLVGGSRPVSRGAP